MSRDWAMIISMENQSIKSMQASIEACHKEADEYEAGVKALMKSLEESP